MSSRATALSTTALTALLLAPAGAAAADLTAQAGAIGDVSRSGNRVVYHGGFRSAEVRVFLDAGGQLVVHDPSGVDGFAGCVNVTSELEARCGTGVTELQLFLFYGDDRAVIDAPVATTVVHGSDGANAVKLGRLLTESHVTYDGGFGNDVADYSGADRFVTVTLDGVADDGRPGDRDNILDTVERVLGTPFPDRFTGNALPQVLEGANGPDTLTGLGGNDRFIEGSRTSGADTLAGGTGKDTVDYGARTSSTRITMDGVADDGQEREADNVGVDVENAVTGSGADILVGSGLANVLSSNGGDDTLTGGGGADTLNGGSGNDLLRARDGVLDVVSCGAGTDVAEVDLGLDTVTGCETVR